MSEHEHTTTAPLTDGEIQANGTAFGALLGLRTGIENITVQIFGVLAALNGVLVSIVTNRNIAIAAGIASAVLAWLYAIRPNRKRWFIAEEDGYAAQKLLGENPTRFGPRKSFRDPSTVRFFPVATDVLILAIALYWVAQIPPIANRLEPAIGYVWNQFFG